VLSAEGNPAPAWPSTSSAWAQAAAAGVRATVYDEQGQVLSTLRGGNPLRFEEIVWIDSTPVARVESSTSAVLTVHAIHTDHLNTPRALVNAQTQGGQPAGTVVWRWRLVNQGTSGSNAFGAMAAEEDPDGNGTPVRFDLRFPGQQYDASTGLHYNYFRDYEAGTGRYVESDPIGLRGGLGTYVYVRANPYGLFDPLGLEATLVLELPGPIRVPSLGAWCVSSPAAAVACGAVGGFGVGTAAYPLIEPYLSPALDYFCREDGVDDTDGNCEALYQSILSTCAGLVGRKKFKCFEAARISRDQCYAERGR
jgi:RHS repeat-associated protein